MCERLCTVTDSPKGNGGESSSLDEDSSDALSPDQLTNQDSPLSAVPQVSPSDVLTQNGDLSPTQVLLRWNRKNWTEQLVKQKQVFFRRIMQLTTVISSHQFLTQPPAPPPPPPPPPPPLLNGSASSPLPKMVTSGSSRHSAGQVKVRRSLKLPVDFRDLKIILTVISIYGNAVAHQNPLLISSFPSPPYFSWFSDCSLRPRRVQTALHRDLRKQRTANQRSEVFVLLSF